MLLADHYAPKSQEFKKIEEVIPRQLSPWSGSEDCLSLAAHWLQTCLEEHSRCGAIGDILSPMPTRVIDVGDSEKNPSLCMTNNVPGSWLTLSYCWGKSSDFVLKKETHEQFVAGLPLEDFPPTIRDAITITKAMNMQYLWVDALCIIQDSVEDWQRESGRMAEVYSNALLTIVAAADSSSGVTDGIFHKRKVSRSAIVPLTTKDFPRNSNVLEGIGEGLKNLEVNNETGQTSLVLSGMEIAVTEAVRPATNILLGDTPKPKNSPWATRAWTLQEQLLSWRTLTFASSQMLWSCPLLNIGEDGKLVKEDRNEDVPDISEFKLEDNQTIGRRAYVKWYRIVTEYSSRRLTFNSDKLIAIASVAQRMNAHLKDEYCVGLWRRELVHGLCWRLWDRGDRPKVVRSYSNEYPSWSWVSVNGGVRYDIDRGYQEAPIKEVIRLKDVNISYTSENTYGQIEKAELVVSGPCCSFRYRDNHSSPKASKLLPYVERYLEADDEFRTRQRLDVPHNLTILQLASASHGTTGHVTLRDWFAKNDFPHEFWFLILEPDELRPHYFRRVALLRLELGNIFTRMKNEEQEEDIEAAKEMKAEPWPVRTVTLI